MNKQFRYEPREVIPDICNYLLRLSNDPYGTTTYDCLHLVPKLMSSVETALHDEGMRDLLLDGDLPDRVRILLEGIGLLPDEEIERRHGMLKSIYEKYVKSESAAKGGFPLSCCIPLNTEEP